MVGTQLMSDKEKGNDGNLEEDYDQRNNERDLRKQVSDRQGGEGELDMLRPTDEQ